MKRFFKTKAEKRIDRLMKIIATDFGDDQNTKIILVYEISLGRSKIQELEKELAGFQRTYLLSESVLRYQAQNEAEIGEVNALHARVRADIAELKDGELRMKNFLGYWQNQTIRRILLIDADYKLTVLEMAGLLNVPAWHVEQCTGAGGGLLAAILGGAEFFDSGEPTLLNAYFDWVKLHGDAELSVAA